MNGTIFLDILSSMDLILTVCDFCALMFAFGMVIAKMVYKKPKTRQKATRKKHRARKRQAFRYINV